MITKEEWNALVESGWVIAEPVLEPEEQQRLLEKLEELFGEEE